MAKKLQKKEELFIALPTPPKRKDIKAGECATINQKGINGHKGLFGKVRKNGTADAVILTHAPRSFGKKNIRLNENPEHGDPKPAYVVRKKKKINIKKVGKKHPNIKVKNKVDKSIIRKIKSTK